MAWEARTAFVEIKVGTRLCIYETPQIRGQPMAALVGSHPMKIQLNTDWINAKIVNATGTSATLELANGDQYVITPLKQGEFDSGIVLRGMHSQDWVVRSKVPPAPPAASSPSPADP